MSIVVLLFGLVAVGGTLLLVGQYLQLVRGFSAPEAVLWMEPPALAMVAAGVSAPLLARRVSADFLMAGALALSSLGYVCSPAYRPSPSIFPSSSPAFRSPTLSSALSQRSAPTS